MADGARWMQGLHPRRRTLLGALALGSGASALGRPALAQGLPAGWPDRPIRFIVGFAAGGPTDVLARRAAQGFQEILGQPIVVENRPGAAGNIGSETVLRAAPDGYTVLVANSGQVVINPHTYERMTFDPMVDLLPVAKMTTGPFLFTINSDLGVSNHADLVALLKRRPDAFKYASTGAGGITHVVTEMWRNRVGVATEPVHFRGTAAAIPDVLAGRTPLFFDGVQQLGPHVQSGKLRAILLTDTKRTPVMPDVPTSKEVGLDDFAVQSWFAMYAPRGTPRAIIDRLSEVNRRVMSAPALTERYAGENVTTDPSTPEQLAQLGRQYSAMFGEAVRAFNIRAE